MKTWIDGMPFQWHLYPPFPFRGPTRKRKYCYLYDPFKMGELVFQDEDGVMTRLPYDNQVYDRVKQFVLNDSRTVYMAQMKFGLRNSQMVIGAAQDKSSEFVYSPRSGVRGIRFSGMGHNGKRKKGAILTRAVWGNVDFEPMEWMSSLRLVSDTLECGDYDSSGSLGQATLSKFWTENGLERIWRLPDGLTAALNKYGVGGRAELACDPGSVYPVAWEIDLDSAYPTAVARGLPVGEPRFLPRGSFRPEVDAQFGCWRIHVHKDIDFSPMPWKPDWSMPEEPLRWKLYDGDELEYCGWAEEIRPLLEMDAISAELKYSWSWGRISTLLAPWVDQLVEHRQQFKRNDLDVASKIMKHVTNAAIGRWGMANENWELRRNDEYDIHLGDLPLDDVSLCGVWVRKVEQLGKTLPYHWNSYVRMAVRMELWRRAVSEMRMGAQIISTNFDSILLAAQPQATNDLETTVVQEEHPWKWKTKVVEDAEIPYVRGVIADYHGQLKSSLPGLSGQMRMAMLVDHMRKRQKKSVANEDNSEESGVESQDAVS